MTAFKPPSQWRGFSSDDGSVPKAAFSSLKFVMKELIQYPELLKRVKQQIQQAQIKVVTSANQQLLLSYWQVGSLILFFQQQQGWGAKVIDRLSADIRQAYPGIEGFSTRNMGYMKKLVAANLPLILQHPVAKLPETSPKSVDVTPVLENADNFEQLFLGSVLSKITCGAARAVAPNYPAG